MSEYGIFKEAPPKILEVVFQNLENDCIYECVKLIENNVIK